MTGRDNIDDAQAIVAALRAENARLRALLAHVTAALTPHAAADWIERGEYERQAVDHAIICVSAMTAVDVAQCINACRAHLAGAAPKPQEPSRAGELHPELLEIAREEGVSLRIDADDTIQIQADSVEHAASTAAEFAWLAAKALDERDAARGKLAGAAVPAEAHVTATLSVEEVGESQDGERHEVVLAGSREDVAKFAALLFQRVDVLVRKAGA
jgi:hypothetical protein